MFNTDKTLNALVNKYYIFIIINILLLLLLYNTNTNNEKTQ